MKKKYPSQIQKWYIGWIIFFGLALATSQYLSNRSIWGDEANLAINIVKLTPGELLHPFENKQVAPILFLQLEKLFFNLTPDKEFGLRLLPYLAFAISIILFNKLAKGITENDFGAILALSSFAFSPVLLFYSSEVKQYITDVLVTTSIYYVLLFLHEKKTSQTILLALIGMTSVFLSNISVIILTASAAYIIFYNYKNHKKINFTELFLLFTSWGATFLLYYYFFINGHPSKGYMLEFWSNANAFMPLSFTSPDAWIFIPKKINFLFTTLFPFSQSLKIIMMIFYAAGLFFMIRNKKMNLIILLILPVIIHFALSAGRLYPFYPRLCLYLIPLLLITCGLGIVWFKSLLNEQINKFIGNIVYAFPVVLLFFLIKEGFPVKKEEIKDIFFEIRNGSTQKYYLDQRLLPGFAFYQSIGHFKDESVIKEVRGPLADLKNDQGTYWLLFSLNYGEKPYDYLKAMKDDPLIQITDTAYSPGIIAILISKKS